MHFDARTLDDNSLIEGDICIVGAGAAGISFALEWINTPYRVILLEGGGFDYEAGMQELYRGKSIGLPYYALEASRLHYFGGTTGHWAGFCSRFDEIDFAERNWVPYSGWPISFEEIEKYYARASEILELSPAPAGPATKQSALKLDATAVWDKMWQFSPPTRFGKKYRDRILQAPNLTLYTYANVTDIQTSANISLVESLTIRNHAGKTHKVRAKTFILACCAIQNARILLASNKQAAKGLGNEHDLVGRFFMEHPEVNAADLFLPKPLSLDPYRLQYFYTKSRAELALSPEKQKELEILNGTVALNPVDAVASTESVENTDSSTADPAASLKEWERAEKYFRSGKYLQENFALSKHFTFFTRMEQAPNPLSRITIDKETDSLGVPRAILDWQLTSLEKKSFRKLVETIGIQVGIAGIGRVRMHEWLWNENDHSWPSFLAGGWHHMGTTRMNASPKEGVVDENCRVHGIHNLYVAGSSCFPTGGSANPTLTLVALTLRLSDHLLSR
jgi:choline dehydrogenase-like flavoprotein